MCDWVRVRVQVKPDDVLPIILEFDDVDMDRAALIAEFQHDIMHFQRKNRPERVPATPVVARRGVHKLSFRREFFWSSCWLV